MTDVFTWFAGAVGEQFGPFGKAIMMVAILAAAVMHQQCSGALKEKGPDRTSLIGYLRRGGSWRWRYTRIVNRALDRLDWLLGDKGQSTRACRWLTGRNGTQPCWTGQSFDRCALLAVAYPVVSMWVIWVVWGETDDIGSLLYLRPDVPLGRRFLGFVLLIAAGYVCVRFAKAAGRAKWFGGLAFLVAVLVASVGAGAGAGAFAFTGAVAVSAAFAGAGAVAVALASAFAIKYLAERAHKAQRAGHFWLAYFPVALLIAYTVLWTSALLEAGPGPLLLIVMLSLVPLLNLPLDWLSIGFTRGLLRRGCAPGGNPALPFLLGAADFVIGMILLMALIIVLILGLQLADALVVHAGGKLLVNVPERLYRLYAEPGATENWWIYVTLFSTLMPSALNLMIGTISLTTVSRRATRADLIRRIRRLPDTGRASTRFRISVRLMLPVFVGSILSGLILWGVFLVLSWFGSLALHTLLFIAAEAADLFPVTPPRP